MEPRIETLEEITLVGKKVRMSLAGNKTAELWRSFVPNRTAIKSNTGSDLYSVEVYDDLTFFNHYDPTREFEKWAAIRVTDFDSVSDEMESLVIPRGLYAVFHYRGKASEAQETYQYIYGSWLPDSVYELDLRPHFALMGEKYRHEDPGSEEELWIPIRE